MYTSRAYGIGVLLTAFLLAFSVPSFLGAQCGGDAMTNGDFEGGFTTVDDSDIPDGWVLFETTPTENSVVSQVADNGPSLPGDSAVNFLRDTGNFSGDHTTIEQVLNLDVLQATCLTLTFDVMVMSHTLEGGGDFEFEWPAYVLVFYEEEDGTPHTFRWGYYLEDPGTGPPSANETQVSQSTWFTDSFDLLSELTFPAVITKIRIGGSGWDFESRFDNVQILTSTLSTFIRGDADGNGLFNGLADGLYALDYQFQGGPVPPCLEAADADGDGVFNGLADGLHILNHQFNGGPPPAAPYPSCGPDPEPTTTITCLVPTACP